MSDIIYLSNVRLSFPHLVEPQKNTDPKTGDERISYNCDLIMPKDHPGFLQFMKTYGELALEKWKPHTQLAIESIQADRKSRCFGQGEEKKNKKKNYEIYEGYAGNVYITASKSTKPQVIQNDGSPIDPANSMAYREIMSKIYAGCRVNAAVRPWLQDNKHGRGIRCDLVAIQFAGDDKPFGKDAPDVSGIFGAVAIAANPAASEPVAMPLPPFMMG